MHIFHDSFINLIFIGIIAMFPVVNPIGTAFIVSPYLEGLTIAEKRKAIGKITFYAFMVCTIALFAGHWILQLFGISIPVVQMAGGIMICKTGWEFLSSDQKPVTVSDTGTDDAPSNYQHLANKLFYPITFPLTTGAGTLSVIFTLSAHSISSVNSDYYMNTLAILIAILYMCLLIYVFYYNTRTLVHYLGANVENIIRRLSAFLIFCVGLQIGITGLKTLLKI